MIAEAKVRALLPAEDTFVGALLAIFKGIKCDAVGCDYRDDEVEFSDLFLDQPCPLCGASLLTIEDLRMIQLTQAACSGPIPDDAERVLVNGKMNGTGTVKFSVAEIMEAARR